MSAYKIQMPGNYPEESVQHSEHSGSLKSRILRDAEQEDDQITDGGIVERYEEMQNYTLEREVKKKRADWEKCIKEVTVRTGLWCHRRKSKRWFL